MGAMFVGQQYLQNVLQYSSLDAGLAIIPAAVFMVLIAPRSAKLVEAQGARMTLLVGYVFCFLGFLTMLLLWSDHSPYWQVGLGYAFIGLGVGLRRHACVSLADGVRARVACRHGVRNSRPPARPRRRHHAVDHGRAPDGRLCGCDRHCGRGLTRPEADHRQRAAGAREVVRERGADRRALPAALGADRHRRGESFVDGQKWAYTAGLVAVLLGAVLVWFMFPRHDAERALLAQYRSEDVAPEPAAVA